MAKTFRPWDVEQRWLLPPSVQEMVPAGHLSHFVRETVQHELDLSEILTAYDEERGYPPYHPVMMTALLLYAYCQGLYSSRKIAKACIERIDFVAVTAMNRPDFRTVNEFRRRHLAALANLFEQVPRLCQRAKMVRLGHVALDGTKMKANASKRKGMSYKRMKETEERFAQEVQSWFEKARIADEQEDALYGADKMGDELPDWVTNKEERRLRIRQAMTELEAEAAAKANEISPDDEPPSKTGGRPKPPAKTNEAKPADKAQLNFTDPDSKIMKSSDGFIQGYNCQAAVDEEAQVIVAHEVLTSPADTPQLVPMVERIKRNLGRHPKELSADTGYCSEANLAELRRRRIRGYLAPERQRHGPATEPRRRKENQGPLTRAMRRRIKQGGFRSRYRLRKQIVEPVFGQIKSARGFSHLSLRGQPKVSAEWAFVCTAHNLLKLAGKTAA